MHEPFSILLTHGYLVVFVWVFADQIGLPIPSLPVLLAAGALAHAGGLSLTAVILLAAGAAFFCDALWFEIGRRRGGSVLKFVCRASLEPDSCVRQTQDMFSRWGSWTLLMSKFVPGMNAVAAPLAGMSGMSGLRFLALNAGGAILFAILFVMPGYIFSRQVDHVMALASASGNWLLAVLAVAFGAYLAFKYARRARFIRLLRVARISPEELKEKLDAGADVVIVDLRHALDFAAAPLTLPGAIRLAPGELAHRHREIPRDREIVLYCTCPDEYTSTRAALLLKRHGIVRVRPLTGGYDTWLQRKFPLMAADGAQETEAVIMRPPGEPEPSL